MSTKDEERKAALERMKEEFGCKAGQLVKPKLAEGLKYDTMLNVVLKDGHTVFFPRACVLRHNRWLLVATGRHGCYLYDEQDVAYSVPGPLPEDPVQDKIEPSEKALAEAEAAMMED